MMNTPPLMVLFLSTGNAVRGLLAESLLRHKGGARFIARSAGCRPMADVHPATIPFLLREDLPTDSLHTKNVKEFLAAAHRLKIDVIVTLSEEARVACPAWPDNPVRVHWPVDDPASADKPDVLEWKMRKCFLTLENRISALVKARLARTPDEIRLQFRSIGMVV